MSLIYRAIWQESGHSSLRRSQECFQDWIAERHGGLAAAEPNSSSEQVIDGHLVLVESVTAQRGGVDGYLGRLSADNEIEQWTTTIRALSNDKEQWIWVDLERLSQDNFTRPNVVAPDIVTMLLDRAVADGARPHLGKVTVDTRPITVSEDDEVKSLVELIADHARVLPVIVFTHGDDDTDDAVFDRAGTAARIVAGIARVFVVAPEAQLVFDSELGKEMSVWGGASRLYLPGELVPVRHRYLVADLVRRTPHEAGQRFAAILSGFTAARRVPVLYKAVRSELRVEETGTLRARLAVAEQEISERNTYIYELRENVLREQDERLAALSEIGVLQQQIEHLRGMLLRSNSSGERPEIDMEMLGTARTVREAVALARKFLTGLAVPDAACRQLDELDTALEADVWAQACWTGLRALNAYALDEQRPHRDFWQWCLENGNADSWPATSKKLSMRESETVLQSDELRELRMLPVAREVDRTGVVLMEAHLKVVVGLGPLTPRIYFFDDKRGPTRKVHVGFIGPQKLMPDTRAT